MKNMNTRFGSLTEPRSSRTGGIALVALTVALCAFSVWAVRANEESSLVGQQESVVSSVTPPGTITPFTMKQRQVHVPTEGGAEILRTTKEHYQRSDGVSKLVRTFYNPDGSISHSEEVFGISGVGFYGVDAEKKQLVFLQPLDDATISVTEDAVRGDAGFDREETIKGQRTLVTRQPSVDATSYKEIYRATELRNLIIKTKTVSGKGEELTEPTEITVGEPDAKLFAPLEQYEVSYEAAEERIRQAEGTGRLDRAALLREKLQKARKDKASDEGKEGR